MKRICAIALIGGLALLVCGCASSSQAQKSAYPANLEQGQSIANQPAERRAEPGAPCLVQDGFAVVDFRAIRDDYDRVSVMGEITNVGIVLKGVELQATLRNADGRLTAAGHFYPASYKNIMPGETWPFAYSFGRQPEATLAELRIVGTFRTSDMPGVTPLMP